MSKRRLVITAVLAGQSQSEVARTYGVSQGWISKLMARYRREGDAAFEPLSRAPASSPGSTPPQTVELVLRLRKELTEAGLDAGADTIGWHLTHHHATTSSRATINRILVRAGTVIPDPAKRPRSSYLRFEAEQPNECWQSDFTHYRLADGTRHVTHRGGVRRIEDGTDIEILSWLDDCSRYALSVTAHAPVTGPIVLATFRTTAATHGFPASTLTDNGRVFTVRLFRGTPGRNHLEHELRQRNITQKNGKPNHPQTPCSMSSSRSTTPADHTGPCHTVRRPPPSTRRCPRPPRARTAAQTPTTASATTRSTKQAASPSASPVNSGTSASDEPTPEPTSSCSSRTSTSRS